MNLYSDENIQKIWGYKSAGSIFTPMKICGAMLNLLNDTGFWDRPTSLEGYAETHRIIDIYCKSGRFLTYAYVRFSMILQPLIPDDETRDRYIFGELLYALCDDAVVSMMLRHKFYDKLGYRGRGNIYNYNLVSDFDKIEELFGDMKFDVVVGNPPYNDDIYLDFVMLGHKLSKQYSLWITPAKFQNKIDIGKSDDKNTEFRHVILSHILKLVYYPETKDIFDILNRGGIAYYLCTQKEVDLCSIENRSLDCAAFNSRSERSISSGTPCLLNFVAGLLDKIDISDNLSLHIDTDKSPYGFVSKITGSITGEVLLRGSFGKNMGYVSKSDIKKGLESLSYYKCITTAKSGGAEIYKSEDKTKGGRIIGLNTLYKYSPYEVCTGDYFVAYYGTEDEVDSFISYMSTKLVNMLYFAHCSNSNINKFCFDLVPNQVFDKIFEDRPLDGYTPDENGEYIDSDGNKHCSLYVKYKLTDEEISIIESVIRERK